MPENLDTEIRKALDAKAHEVEVPGELATRTLEHVQALGRPSLRERVRSWRDARRMRAPVTGYPRWLYVSGAVATAVLLFVVGFYVTTPRRGADQLSAPQPPTTEAQPRSAGGDVFMDAPLEFRVGRGEADEQPAPPGDASVDATRGTPEERDSSAGSIAGPVDDADRSRPPVPAPRAGNIPPKLIETAQIEVEVDNFDRDWTAANDVASKHGGFVTNSGTEQVREKLSRGTLTMRVPAAKLDAALRDLRGLGKMTNMSTTGEDVSAQLIDLKARTKSLRAEELQLLELLSRTSRISEVLEIRSRLDTVRQEIESLKAQSKYYEDQVDYATINATIFEEGAEPDDDPGDGILGDAWETALRIGLTIVAGTVVVLGGLIPLAALGFAVWFVVRMLRRRRPA